MVRVTAIIAVSGLLVLAGQTRAGIIKDIFQKATSTNNKTDETVRESAPICGSGIFSTPNEGDLSPEIIFVSGRQSRAVSADDGRSRQEGQVNEVAREFRFHPENVTLAQLEEHGFNDQAPVSFLMHGFTSGYPLQAWISAVVEAYTIDRELSAGSSSSRGDHEGAQQNERGPANIRRVGQGLESSCNPFREVTLVEHNLFIVNWNYAARGIIYPRAVANIPIVASYVTRFINERLLDEARVEPKRIQLIGHSLGAHLAGFIGKNTRSKVGRIYGLDPAGPCFGAISGPLYPASKRLAPGDADEVITIQTNSALLGIEKPLGRYSVYVEGGANQPGCKASGLLKSLGTLTWDGGDFDTVACSHSRAPNLITYRHDQKDYEENCLMVAYACKDWDSFLKGQCGVCSDKRASPRRAYGGQSHPLDPVPCIRIGLDWQYPTGPSRDFRGNRNDTAVRWSTRKPFPGGESYRRDRRDLCFGPNGPIRPKRNSGQDERRDSTRGSNSPPAQNTTSRRRKEEEDDVEPIAMFLRTSDTQPYCAFHYQLVLELNEPFEKDEPAMSIILQDSQPDRERRRGSAGASRNSISSDEFGHKFNDTTYTHLLTSYRKLRQIDHGTLIVRDGLKDGHRLLRALHVNYMSNPDPEVNRRLSTRLCPVRTDTDREAISGEGANRFYFKPCQRDRGQEGARDRD